MNKIIEPKVLKGFRDYLPKTMINKKKIIYHIEQTFESFGFSPIDTPCIEYTEILLGKGGTETDKQLYRFTDNGGRDVTLRFDLTVPLARFISQHYNELGIPFKAYHIGQVWRGENTHKGRYREFYQCDFDILGTESNLSDIEIIQIIYKSLSEIIKSDKFSIRLNNRVILNSLLKQLNLIGKSTEVLRVIDKIRKEPLEKIKLYLSNLGIENNNVNKIIEFVSIEDDNKNIINYLTKNIGNNEGIDNIKEIINILEVIGIPNKCIKIDLSIARGLDYYTGNVFETILEDLPNIGSICSGGRYNNLASLYSNNKIPGVGASIGIDRLISALEELGKLENRNTTADLIIINIDSNYTKEYFRLAKIFRENNIKTDFFTDNKKIDKQLKYADRKGIRFAITNASNEFENNIVKLKDLKKSLYIENDLKNTINYIKKELSFIR
jgi:histidyl-tRNA synthetase